MTTGRGCGLLPVAMPRSRTARNGGLVAEDFVDDGDNVGDIDAPVVVHVALLGGEGDDHLGVGRDGAGEGVAFDVGGDVESVEDDLVESAAWLWVEGEGVVGAFHDVGCCDFVSNGWRAVDRDGTSVAA